MGRRPQFNGAIRQGTRDLEKKRYATIGPTKLARHLKMCILSFLPSAQSNRRTQAHAHTHAHPNKFYSLRLYISKFASQVHNSTEKAPRICGERERERGDTNAVSLFV